MPPALRSSKGQIAFFLVVILMASDRVFAQGFGLRGAKIDPTLLKFGIGYYLRTEGVDRRRGSLMAATLTTDP
jgi:hypothetical protein